MVCFLTAVPFFLMLRLQEESPLTSPPPTPSDLVRSSFHSPPMAHTLLLASVISYSVFCATLLKGSLSPPLSPTLFPLLSSPRHPFKMWPICSESSCGSHST